MIVLVVFVPTSRADAVRRAAAETGAGHIGNYRACSFSARGTGRFEPLDGAHPAIGRIGELEEVAEERIEVVCDRAGARRVLDAVLAAHPYEEPAYHLYETLDPATL
ncbi:MAG: hypothetical protein ACQERF_08105 [Actinomycetota bacterium]